MIQKLDHIELYVANAIQAKYFYQNALGFKQIGYKINKDSSTNSVSFLLEQGTIRLVLTSTAKHDHDIANHVHVHGDSIKDIVFETENVDEYFTKAVSNGAQPVQHPTIIRSQNGDIKKASISTFGNTLHSFIERSNKNSFFLPNYNEYNDSFKDPKIKLKSIDHIAIAVDPDALRKWQDFYSKVFGFYESYQLVVETKNSGMKSAVMNSKDNSTKFVFVSPLREGSKSQISEFLHFHNGAGVQHIAFSSEDIFESVYKMKQNGIEFLSIPDTYYNDLPHRLKQFNEDIQNLQKSQVLLDRDEKGYLLQAFTKPVHTRPTLFFEVVQRKGAEGFGEGNVKALFEAVEKEQMNRGKI